MEKINNILVTLSFETKEQAEINHALTLAKLYNSKIVLFSVVPNLSTDEKRQISAMSPKERLQNIVAQREQKLIELAKKIKNKGYNANYIVRVGTPSTEVINQVIQSDYDLVIISTRQRKSFKETLFGSTSNAVLRNCPTPVLAIKPDHSGTYNQIMASVDISQDSNIINNKILSEAKSLAKADNSKLHALTVIAAKIPNQDGENPRDEAKMGLAALTASQNIKIPSSGLHVEVGDAAIAILEAVQRYNIDLLVMGMASRTGLMGFFIGNLAEKIMSSVDCSILTVKPDGFKSQIQH